MVSVLILRNFLVFNVLSRKITKNPQFFTFSDNLDQKEHKVKFQRKSYGRNTSKEAWYQNFGKLVPWYQKVQLYPTPRVPGYHYHLVNTSWSYGYCLIRAKFTQCPDPASCLLNNERRLICRRDTRLSGQLSVPGGILARCNLGQQCQSLKTKY